MRVFISCDIEGITTTTVSEEINTQAKPERAGRHAEQMTREVVAACEGAVAAGADYILVRDAHGAATNIDATQLPACAELMRGWSGHPYLMAEGVDRSFSAAMFVGYHSAAGRNGNPLSHTVSSLRVFSVKLNGATCSEFRLYSWACALEGVPTVFLTGDKMLCDDSEGIHPMLRSVAVKDGCGGMTRAISPALAVTRIREESEKALRQDLKRALCELPREYVLEVSYKDQANAVKMSHFPGVVKADDNTVRLTTKNYFEVLRAASFIL